MENYKDSRSADKKTIEALEKELGMVKDQLRNSKNENKTLNTRLGEKPKTEYIETSNKEELNELVGQISELKDEKSNLQYIIQEMERKLGEKEQSLVVVESEKKEKEREHESAIEKLNSNLKAKDELVKKIVDLQKQQNSEIEGLRMRIVQTEQNINQEQKSSRNHVIEYESKLTDLQSKNIHLKKENERLINDIDCINDRYKELQDHSSEGQMELQEFFNKELRKKEQVISSLEKDVEDLRRKYKNDIENAIYERSRKIEQNDELRQSAWVNEKELLNDQIRDLKERISDNRTEYDRLKSEKNSLQGKEVEIQNLKFMNDNLKTDLQASKDYVIELKKQTTDMFAKLEEKNEEIKNMILFKEKYENSREDYTSLKSKNQMMEDEIIQINSDIKAQKERIKSLLKNLDEISNEKLFYEAKVERLENRLMDLLYKDKRQDPAQVDQNHLKKEIMSKLTRTEESEQEAHQIVQRVPTSAEQLPLNEPVQPDREPEVPCQRGLS